MQFPSCVYQKKYSMNAKTISQFRDQIRIALRHLFVVTIAAALLAGCASFEQPVLPAADMHTALTQLAIRRGVCGVSVAVIKNRKLDSVESASGCTTDSALEADRVFQAASLSKPVFAYAVLKLVAQGKLDLDTPVVQYLPIGYWHSSKAYLVSSPTELVKDVRLQTVTVRMALNHTSGLPNWANGALTFDLNPSNRWHYSGEAYVLLQRAVEAVTGMPLDQFMRQEIFNPLAMTHSDYILSPRVSQNLMAGSDKNGNPIKVSPILAPVAAFSLYTSAQDYGKFLEALLNDPVAIEKITQSPVMVDSGLNLNWGLGWGIQRSTHDTYLWHWGNNPGYRAFVMLSTQTGDGLVMLTNSANGLALAEPLTRQVLPGKHPVFRFHMLRD